MEVMLPSNGLLCSQQESIWTSPSCYCGNPMVAALTTSDHDIVWKMRVQELKHVYWCFQTPLEYIFHWISESVVIKVNGLHSYNAFLSLTDHSKHFTVQLTFTHSHRHSYSASISSKLSISHASHYHAAATAARVNKEFRVLPKDTSACGVDGPEIGSLSHSREQEFTESLSF